MESVEMFAAMPDELGADGGYKPAGCVAHGAGPARKRAGGAGWSGPGRDLSLFNSLCADPALVCQRSSPPSQVSARDP
jgi:hypothetical protein